MIIQLFLMNLFTWQRAESLNFLLIVIDDLRPALGSYGDENAFTPNIDKLTENGILFSRTYAQVRIVEIYKKIKILSHSRRVM